MRVSAIREASSWGARLRSAAIFSHSALRLSITFCVEFDNRLERSDLTFSGHWSSGRF